MFDILGIISFLIIIICLVALVASIFNRNVNKKRYLTVLACSLIVFFSSYAIDVNIIEKNKKPVEIDYSGIVIPPPTPEPTPEPTPTPTPTPIPEYEEDAENEEVPEESEEPTPEPSEENEE